MAKPISASAGLRQRRRPVHGGNPATAFRRFKDWNIIKELGEDAVLGSEIGRMFAHDYLTAREASAARLYAEITARYDKYHGVTRRDAKSPAYEYSTGKDDEIARRERDGSIEDYEYRAKQARKAYERLHGSNNPDGKPVEGCVPALARDMVEEVCLYDRALSERHRGDFKIVMRRVADAFHIEHKEAAIPPSVAQKVRHNLTHNELRSRDAVNTIDRWFSAQGGAVSGYRLTGMVNETECGIEGLGLSKDAKPIRHVVLISRGKALLEHLNSLLDRAASTKGWKQK